MIQSFDPSNKVHVQWLKSVIDASTEEKAIHLRNNPMGKDFPPLEMVQVLFGLSMKYTQAVFKKTAYILE
jgi:hypothetical protein